MIRFLLLSLFLTRITAAQPISIVPGVETVPVVIPTVRLDFETVAGRHYRIESSQDLATWQPEGYAFAGTGHRMSAMASNHGLPKLFYRIRNDASPAETAPINPYGAVVSSQPFGNPATITAAEIDPANDKLIVMDSSSPGEGFRSISIAELRNIPGSAPRWGDITGSIADQQDLAVKLEGLYSVTNPPGWSVITGKPSNLFGYGITDAVSTSTIGFMDRFARYPNQSALVTGLTLPEIGRAWRFNLTGKDRFGATTISASAADSSFNDSADGFLTQRIVVGDLFAIKGFSNAQNNGTFRVMGASEGKITVSSPTGSPVQLADEAAGAVRTMQGGYPPYVENGALRAADKTLFYIGAPTRTTDGHFSMTFEVELKPSIYSSGIYGAAITIGIQPSELLLEQGGLNLGNPIHCQINESGIHDNGFYGLAPLYPGSGSHPVQFVPGKSFPKNVKQRVTCVVEGDEMRVSALGGTIVYRDPRLSDMIGDPDTHWFYETNGDSLGNNLYANVFHLHRIWVNAPELDRVEGWGLPENPQTSTVPAALAVPNDVPLVAGTSIPAEIVGSAGDKTPLVSVNGHVLNQPGDYERATIHGSFPNAHPKSLTLQVNGSEVWNSGSLSDSGEWTLQIDRVYLTSGAYQLNIRYESETSRRFGHHNGTAAGGPGFTTELRGTSTHDGDVVVRASLTSVSIK